MMTSSWKIVKRLGLLLRVAYEFVVELCPLWYWLGEEGESFVVARISPT
jgi:hypothetical protein